MANLSYTATASLNISGITPDAGPTSTVNDAGSYTSSAVEAGDREVRTYVVNAATTPAVALDMGKITAGKALWLESDGALDVSLTQDFGAGAVVNKIRMEKFLYLESPFTVVAVENNGGTAVNLSYMVVGDRDAVGVGGGVY